MFVSGVAKVSATTLMMPDRDALMGVNVVVWGNTNLPNTTAFTLDCGNATTFAGTVGVAGDNRYYIARVCNDASAGTFTRKLLADTDPVATAKINVLDSGALTP